MNTLIQTHACNAIKGALFLDFLTFFNVNFLVSLPYVLGFVSFSFFALTDTSLFFISLLYTCNFLLSVFFKSSNVSLKNVIKIIRYITKNIKLLDWSVIWEGCNLKKKYSLL